MKNIKICNQKLFENLLKNIKKWWFKNLHFVVDFDRTLTKNTVNWKQRPSLIWVMRQWGYLWEEYSKKAFELYDFYHPLEIDPTLSMSQKKVYMTEWWEKHLKLLVKSRLHKDDIDKVVNSGILKLREGVWYFLETLDKNSIPIVIISANWLWWDSIELYLRNKNLFKDNISIISNKFIWDKNLYAVWYEKPLIHVFNKDETVLKDFPEIHKKVKNRKNVILIWDSLWDPHMADGFDYENLLKIGFLNEKEDELINHYQEKYDVVITWDSDFSFLNNLFQ